MKIEDLKIKTEILCWGIKPSKIVIEEFLKQNPFCDKRTGNAGVQLLLFDRKVIVNAPILSKFTQYSPYELKRLDNGGLYLEKEGGLKVECDVLESPPWYKEKISDIEITKFVIQEGINSLIATIYNNCIYKTENVECKFCALQPSKSIILKEELYKDSESLILAIGKAYSSNHHYHLTVTGGNTSKVALNDGDNGIKNYIRFMECLRKENSIKVCIEDAPPVDLEDLKHLVNLGTNAFSINLEIWNEKLRQLFCPGKSKIKREKYFETWEYIVSLLGKDMVASVLVGGLESKESTLEGGIELLKRGVVPTIVPFRRNDSCYLESFASPNPEEMTWIYLRLGEEMCKHNSKPWLQPGCTACAACSVEQDVQKKIMENYT